LNLSVPKVKVLYRDCVGVKLQKQLSRHFGGREYAKWVVVLPPKIVKELGWNEGLELRVDVEGRSLRLKPASRTR
jgi:hypothetical protein